MSNPLDELEALAKKNPGVVYGAIGGVGLAAIIWLMNKGKKAQGFQADAGAPVSITYQYPAQQSGGGGGIPTPVPVPTPVPTPTPTPSGQGFCGVLERWDGSRCVPISYPNPGPGPGPLPNPKPLPNPNPGPGPNPFPKPWQQGDCHNVTCADGFHCVDGHCVADGDGVTTGSVNDLLSAWSVRA